MSDWRSRLVFELEGLAIPPERMTDLVEEMALDLEERARSARAGGATDEEADRLAWAGLGSLAELRSRLLSLHGATGGHERAREAPLGRPAAEEASPLAGLGDDLRLALRALRKSPGFTAAALLTLALGIGANTTLFSVVNAIFLTPLPVAEPERLVAVFTSDFSGPPYGGSSYPDYEDLRAEPGLFASLGAYAFEAVALRTDREPARIWGEFVTGSYFPTLKLPVARGRALGPEDDAEGATPSVVVSDGLWKRILASDPQVVGRTITLGDTAFTIVGVAPEAFTGMMRGVVAEVWIPIMQRKLLVPGDPTKNRGSRFLGLVGRLVDGLSPEAARARLDVVAARLRGAYPEQWTDRRGETRRLSLLREDQMRVPPAAQGQVASFSALIAVVVALILLIACANVANLMLARASTRRRELAVRLALGASRARLVRHFMAESLLVSGLGGALGLLLAGWAAGAIRSLALPLPVPMHLEVVLDGRVLAFALGLTLLTGSLLGLGPAWHAAGADLVPALKDEGSGVATGARGSRIRRLFVAAQVALSLVLLVGAGLLLRGLSRATTLSPGFSVDEPYLVPVDVGLASYEAPQAAVLIDRLAEKAPSVPGVAAFGLTLTLPLEIHVSRRNTVVDGYVRQPGEEMEFYFGVVGPGHFDALRIPILRGREFTPEDREGAPGVTIVNETFAARFWPGEDPVGRTFRVRGEDGPLVTVVGLARDSKYRTLAEAPMPFYYLPLLQDYGFVKRYARLFPLHVVVRGSGDGPAMARGVLAALREIDPKLPAYPPKPMVAHLGLTALPARVASVFFAGFGLLGLLLASLGLYGVVAYAVAQRTQEIGLRMALGASREKVLRMVIEDGLAVTLKGVAVGVLLSAGLGVAMRALLYGLSPFDPVTFVLVPLVLLAVAVAATLLPARRAARVDPAVALRCE